MVEKATFVVWLAEKHKEPVWYAQLLNILYFYILYVFSLRVTTSANRP